MNNLHHKVKEYLESLENGQNVTIDYHGENEISDRIKGILQKDETYKETKYDYAEHAAFSFFVRGLNDQFGWGTYYGPLFVMPNNVGQMMEYPSITRVDEETLQYWAKRAEESKNPILSSRYADLVVDFSQKILKTNAHIDLVRKVIDSNITICEKSLAHPLDCKTKIKRALDLSIQVNDTDRINKAKDAIIQLEKDIAEDDKPGLWGFSFKWLLLNSSKNITLSGEEKNKLVDDIERRLKIMEKDTWAIENVVPLLAEHYANEKDKENLMRVLGILENTLKTDERLNSSPILITNYYQKILGIYEKYGTHFPESQEAYKRTLREIGQLDLDWKKSLQTISVTGTIENETVANYLKAIFGKIPLDLIIAKMVYINLPKKDTMREGFDNNSNGFKMDSISSKQIISEDGILIAEIPPLEESTKDNHLKLYASQYIQDTSIFLFLAMDELRKQFTKQQIIEHFEESLIFRNEDKEYINRAISAYWEEDYLVSSHLFIPLIESGIRELVRLRGGMTLYRNQENGYANMSLGNLLHNNDEILEDVFLGGGEDVLYYFRLVLIDNLGLNLRNEFAHGLCKKKFLNRHISDILFFTLMILLTLKQETKKITPQTEE